MEIASINSLQECECVSGSSDAAKDKGMGPRSSKLLTLNCAIIVFSVFSLFITLLEPVFKKLLRLYSFMVVNRLICALLIFSFLRYTRSFGRSSTKALFLLHFVNQANYIGISAAAISTKVPSTFPGYPLKSVDNLNVFLGLCFTAILSMEIMNLVYVCNIFPETQKHLVTSRPVVSKRDLKLNLCIFTLFGYSLFADCVYIICSVVAYLEYALLHGYYTESILCSLSGICVCISFIGLTLGISFLSFLRDSRANQTAAN